LNPRTSKSSSPLSLISILPQDDTESGYCLPLRARLSGSTNGNIDEEGEEGGSDDGRRKRVKGNHKFVVPTRKLACPFFKMNPSKYCVQHNQDGQVDDKQYRICAAGPGFKNIQLSKYALEYSYIKYKLTKYSREHLRRKHYPVQCDQCYRIFKFRGKDRPPAVTELQKHQLVGGCSQNSPSMEESILSSIDGEFISSAQWTKLDEKKHSKTGKSVDMEKRKVDRWNDIWRILFPNIPSPLTPCKRHPLSSNATKLMEKKGIIIIVQQTYLLLLLIRRNFASRSMKEPWN
jgi:hypothetical protein